MNAFLNDTFCCDGVCIFALINKRTEWLFLAFGLFLSLIRLARLTAIACLCFSLRFPRTLVAVSTHHLALKQQRRRPVSMRIWLFLFVGCSRSNFIFTETVVHIDNIHSPHHCSDLLESCVSSSDSEYASVSCGFVRVDNVLRQENASHLKVRNSRYLNSSRMSVSLLPASYDGCSTQISLLISTNSPISMKLQIQS